MSNQVIVDLFAEDRAHESFLEPLLTRIAREQDQGIEMEIRVRSARGGHSRAIAEFELYQSIVTKSLLSSESADIVVVAIDGNCSTFTEERRRIQDATVPMLRDRLVIACPDPHIERWISSVVLLERLREVNALLGFTRVEAPEETVDPDERPPMANICADAPTWVPAGRVHGEGIFIRFNEDVLQKWERRDSVRARDDKLILGHKGWRNARRLNPDEGYPGARYVLLHTIAHLLIRELALECGYNAASIRERIYADAEGEQPQAGVLVYTAAADSDGTLGGLVNLGKPENFGRLFTQALSRARICSSDPLCAEHEPNKDRSLHAAACHACSFVSETSCERGNRYIDRALVVPTLEVADAALFDEFLD